MTDANSLAWLCRLEIGTRRAIEWLGDNYSIKITEVVFNEAKNNIPYTEDDALSYLEGLRSHIDRELWYYDEKFDSRLENLPPSVKGHGKRVDKGERTAGILALKTSRRNEYPITLITDDNDATEPLEHIFEIEKIGPVEDSFGMLRYIWSRNSEKIAKRSINIALQDLKSFMSGDRTPDENFKGAKRKLERMTEKPN